MPDELQRLRANIRKAFPPIRFCGVVTECSCEECQDVRRALQHKSWNEIGNEFIDLTCSPVLLEPEAFHAFLPAYMLRALDLFTGDSVVAEFTVYSLCPHVAADQEPEDHNSMTRRVKYLHDRAQLMSAPQLEAIRDFLSFMAENAAGGKYLRPLATAAAETIWRQGQLG